MPQPAGNSISRDDAAPIVQVRHLSKHFGMVKANDDLSLDLFPGEIHALLGENGAGKSTFLNILAGMLQPDAGQIVVNGAPVTIDAPATALQLGIGTVFQHFTLVPNLTVRENLQLGGTGWLLGSATSHQAIASSLETLDLAGEIDTEIRYLSLGARQRVEIAKALYRGARILLLDEPTAVLSPVETGQFFQTLGQLRLAGVAVVLITHKLEEALDLSDRVTVLRQGRITGQFTPGELAGVDRSETRQRVLQLMFEQMPAATASRMETVVSGEVLLDVRNVTARDDRGRPALRDLNLELRAGEILGIAGVDGNGQKELAEVLAGQRRVETGSIVAGQQVITNQGVRRFLTAGIGYITDDRLGEGVIASATVAENLALKGITRQPLRQGFWLHRGEMNAAANRLVEQFDIRTADIAAPAGSLSGGNVQKLLLARELALQPRVLICNKPAAGLDLRTAESILAMLRAAADAGAAVVLISPEIDELLSVSDRIGVMFDGEMVAVLARDEINQETLNSLIVGAAPGTSQATDEADLVTTVNRDAAPGDRMP